MTDATSSMLHHSVLQVVNKLAMDKYDILWLANGDMFKMKKEVTAQLWNKVGKHQRGSLFPPTTFLSATPPPMNPRLSSPHAVPECHASLNGQSFVPRPSSLSSSPPLMLCCPL